MPEFLETIETLRASEATSARLYGGEGTRVRGGHRADPAYQRNLAGAATLIADVMEGRRPVYHLQEAMTTSDFPLLMADIMDRQILANYQAAPAIWSTLARRRVVSSFRSVKTFDFTGLESGLDVVEEQEEYPAGPLNEARALWAIKKYGRRFPFSWELMINDDLEMIRRAPEALGAAARNTENRFATGLHAGTTGPLGTVYTAGNKNQIITANGALSNNPPLSIAGLQDAMTVLGNQISADGEPIVINAVVLEVPPSLMVTAQSILNATSITLGADTGVQRITTNNWMRGMVELVVNPFLPLISTTNGATTWYVHAASTGRAAFDIGFLRGHESPELFMKASNQVLVGGGAAGPEDFDTDTIQYKIRHVLGGAAVDPKLTVASNGTGA